MTRPSKRAPRIHQTLHKGWQVKNELANLHPMFPRPILTGTRGISGMQICSGFLATRKEDLDYAYKLEGCSEAEAKHHHPLGAFGFIRKSG